MSIFQINKGDDTPEVLFDRENGTINFTGKLLPEDSVVFFVPIEEQLREYLSKPNQVSTVNLRLEYMNSSSQKGMLELLTLLQSLTKNGFEVHMNWYYPEEDDDLLDEGKDLSRMLDNPLSIIPY